MHSSSRVSGGNRGARRAAGRGHRAPAGRAFVRDAGGTDGNAAALAALCAWNKKQPEASFAVQKREGARKGNVTRQRWAACPVVLGPLPPGQKRAHQLMAPPWLTLQGQAWGLWEP